MIYTLAWNNIVEHERVNQPLLIDLLKAAGSRLKTRTCRWHVVSSVLWALDSFDIWSSCLILWGVEGATHIRERNFAFHMSFAESVAELGAVFSWTRCEWGGSVNIKLKMKYLQDLQYWKSISFSTNAWRMSVVNVAKSWLKGKHCQ